MVFRITIRTDGDGEVDVQSERVLVTEVGERGRILGHIIHEERLQSLHGHNPRGNGGAEGFTEEWP